jgi:hypothetical protein
MAHSWPPNLFFVLFNENNQQHAFQSNIIGMYNRKLFGASEFSKLPRASSLSGGFRSVGLFTVLTPVAAASPRKFYCIIGAVLFNC